MIPPKQKNTEKDGTPDRYPATGLLLGVVALGFATLTLVILAGDAVHTIPPTYLRETGVLHMSVEKWDIPLRMYLVSLGLTTTVKCLIALALGYTAWREILRVGLCNLGTHPVLWSAFFLFARMIFWDRIALDRAYTLQWSVIFCQCIVAFWEWKLLDTFLPLRGKRNLALALSMNFASYVMEFALRTYLYNLPGG